MPEFNFYNEVDVDDFYDAMDRYDKQEMFDLLKQDFEIEEDPHYPSAAEAIFFEAVDKIKQSRLQLTLEQEEMLLELARSL